MDYAIISLGAVFFLTLAGASFRAASLRGDINEKWGIRVSVAEAGLRELAVNHLTELHQAADERLIDEGPFDPAKVVADPAEMVSYAQDFLATIKVLDRIQKQFRWLLLLGPCFLMLLVGMALGVVAVFGHLGEAWTNSKLYDAGLLACIVAGALLLFSFILYAHLQHALTGAELLAASANNDD